MSYLRDLYARIWDGTNTASVSAGGAVKVAVDSSALPTGAATSANQTNGTQQVRLVDASTNQMVLVAPSTPANLSAWAEKGVRVLIGPTDIISNIPVILEYDHHQLHEGEFWHWDVYIANLASAANYDVVFTVPNIVIPAGSNAVTLCPHFRYEVEVNDLCNVFLYEAPTVTAATGTARTPINFERNAAYTPKLAILDAPTITVVGTQIDAEYFLQGTLGGKTGGGAGGSINEFVLKNNTVYLFRVTSGATGCDIHVDFHWYEDLGV